MKNFSALLILALMSQLAHGSELSIPTPNTHITDDFCQVLIDLKDSHPDERPQDLVVPAFYDNAHLFYHGALALLEGDDRTTPGTLDYVSESHGILETHIANGTASLRVLNNFFEIIAHAISYPEGEFEYAPRPSLTDFVDPNVILFHFSQIKNPTYINNLWVLPFHTQFPEFEFVQLGLMFAHGIYPTPFKLPEVLYGVVGAPHAMDYNCYMFAHHDRNHVPPVPIFNVTDAIAEAYLEKLSYTNSIYQRTLTVTAQLSPEDASKVNLAIYQVDHEIQLPMFSPLPPREHFEKLLADAKTYMLNNHNMSDSPLEATKLILNGRDHGDLKLILQAGYTLKALDGYTWETRHDAPVTPELSTELNQAFADLFDWVSDTISPLLESDS